LTDIPPWMVDSTVADRPTHTPDRHAGYTGDANRDHVAHWRGARRHRRRRWREGSL